MPTVKFGRLNAAIKARKQREEARRARLNQRARAAGIVPPGGIIPTVPVHTAIVPPPVWRPRTDIDLVKSNYYFDSGGNPSQGTTPGVPNQPFVTEIVPGVPYAADLAAKTSPITEPGGASITEYTNGGLVAPGTVTNSTTGQHGARPERLIPITPVNFTHHNPPPPPKPPANPEDWTLPKPPVEGFQFQIHPQAPRARFPGDTQLPASDLELRDRLQVPRRQLKVWINSGPGGAPQFILNLPYKHCRMDAKDGPKCVDQHTIAIHGNVTGVKRLVFECFEALPLFFSEGQKDDAAARLKGDVVAMRMGIDPGGAAENDVNVLPLNPPIISNRWTMRQEPDPETYLNSTVIEGKAVFRMDILARLGMTADQLRAYIFPPIAHGYIRKPATVVIGGEGNELIYMLVDHQQMMNNPGGHRWGVHSVVVANSVTANNPLDRVFGNPGGLADHPLKPRGG